MRILIVGADSLFARNVLAAVRSFGRAGHTVAIGSPAPGLAARSRWCARWERIPTVSADPAGFRKALVEVTTRGPYDVVFAGGDAEVLALTMWRDDLQACVPYASHEIVRAALDKYTIMAAATQEGLGLPMTLGGDADLTALEYPAVVKARLHWTPGADEAPNRLQVAVVQSAGEAQRRFDVIRRAGGEPIIQEWLPGSQRAYIGVIDDRGRAIVALEQQASETWPPGAGVWTRARVVPLDPDLATRCEAFLRRLGWYGLAQLQFIVPPDGVPRLIDVNGRFYASMGLAMAAGADLPMIWLRMATGESMKPRAPLKTGMRYQWFEGDIQRALLEGRGGVLRDAVSTVVYHIGATHSMWDEDDPRPSAYRGTEACRSLIRGLRRAGTRRS
jgi:predicted ATP-grasp superfamily ATP-dependent carboligase